MGLTIAGRGRLARARGAAEHLVLAEAPQHREWRQKHTTAVEGIEGYRERMREALRGLSSCSGMSARTPKRGGRWPSVYTLARSCSPRQSIARASGQSQTTHNDGLTTDDRRRLVWRLEEDA
jgi:hypothetical protein